MESRLGSQWLQLFSSDSVPCHLSDHLNVQNQLMHDQRPFPWAEWPLHLAFLSSIQKAEIRLPPFISPHSRLCWPGTFLGSICTWPSQAPSHPSPAKLQSCLQRHRADRSTPPDPGQYNSQPKAWFRTPLPATMSLGAYVCGYLSGMGISAKVILMLTDTSVYSGRISLKRSSSCPGLQTSGM